MYKREQPVGVMAFLFVFTSGFDLAASSFLQSTNQFDRPNQTTWHLLRVARICLPPSTTWL